MQIWFYKNKRNPHKYQEVHYDGYGHYLVREVMRFENDVINHIGDGKLHRWRKANLSELLEDYFPYPDEETWQVLQAQCSCCRQWGMYVMSLEEEKSYDEWLEAKIYGKPHKLLQEAFPKVPAWIRSGSIDYTRTNGFCICPRCSR